VRVTPHLSVLVCSVAERCDNFAVEIQRRIYEQVNKLDNPSEVEVIVLSDNRQMSIGTKRNHLVRMASGQYTVFVDDDDDIADDYVTSLLEATASGADVLTFRLEYRLNGKKKWTIKHSIHYTDDNRRGTNTPRHTSAVRRDIALQLPFPETSYGEDAEWAKSLLKVAESEHIIDKTLYIYRDVPATSVARQYAANHSPLAFRAWEQSQPYSLGPRLGSHPHAALRHVLKLRPKGVGLEFGVGEGATLRMIAAQMPAYGFDSFQGLPEKWRDGFDKGMFACERPTIRNASIVPGLFEDTLPNFSWPERIGLVHLDADLYSSTKTVLDHLGPHLRRGCFLVFDEWHGFEGAGEDAHEQRAFREFATRTKLTWTVVGHGPEQWVVRID